jgi:hypothetical protein
MEKKEHLTPVGLEKIRQIRDRVLFASTNPPSG